MEDAGFMEEALCELGYGGLHRSPPDSPVRGDHIHLLE